jgi:signal peptidase II
LIPKLRVLLTTLAITIGIDQLSKAWVSARIPVGSVEDWVPVIDGFFYITHYRNPGASFGLMIDWPWQGRLVLFTLVVAVAVAVVLSFYRGLAPGERFNAAALGLILGGSLGNYCDRLIRGEVVDFLHFRLWGAYSWPDFNAADSFIVLGVLALMLELLASEGASRASSDELPGAQPGE